MLGNIYIQGPIFDMYMEETPSFISLSTFHLAFPIQSFMFKLATKDDKSWLFSEVLRGRKCSWTSITVLETKTLTFELGHLYTGLCTGAEFKVISFKISELDDRFCGYYFVIIKWTHYCNFQFYCCCFIVHYQCGSLGDGFTSFEGSDSKHH